MRDANTDAAPSRERELRAVCSDLRNECASLRAELTQARQERKEVCICAAICMPDGYIIRGHRHNDCLDTMSRHPIYSYHLQRINSTQGFLTTRNRFVDREEGFRLQIAAGIESRNPNGYVGNELYSEDLY